MGIRPNPRALALLALAPLALLLACASPEIALPETTTLGKLVEATRAAPAWAFNEPLAYLAPGWETARSARVDYAAGRSALVAWPALEVAEPLPTILVVSRYPDTWYRSKVGKPYGELIPALQWIADLAAAGFVVVVPSVDSAAADLRLVMAWLAKTGPTLGMDIRRLGLFAASDMGLLVPVVLGSKEANGVKAIALHYATVQQGSWALPAGLALRVVKAGKDDPATNEALDELARRVRESGNPLEIVGYEEGEHAFDWMERGGEAETLLKGTIDFFREYL